jgi:undecaprenyl pyrophosphate phosphatase UppP
MPAPVWGLSGLIVGLLECAAIPLLLRLGVATNAATSFNWLVALPLLVIAGNYRIADLSKAFFYTAVLMLSYLIGFAVSINITFPSTGIPVYAIGMFAVFYLPGYGVLALLTRWVLYLLCNSDR